MKSLIAAAILGLSLTSAASAATVFSDDFNTDIQGAPQATLSQWAIVSGSIDVIGPGSFDWCGAGQGNCLDMNGSTSMAGRIETTIFSLIVGKIYTLTFDFGNNQNSQFLTPPEVLSFGLGATSYALNIFAQSALTASLAYTFTAGSTSEILFFADIGTSPGDNGGPLLDNVVLSTVPLPAGGLLLLGALGGIAALRRRKTA